MIEAEEEYFVREGGARLGERAGDEPQFDPGVLTEGGVTWMYTGFCMRFCRVRLI